MFDGTFGRHYCRRNTTTTTTERLNSLCIKRHVLKGGINDFYRVKSEKKISSTTDATRALNKPSARTIYIKGRHSIMKVNRKVPSEAVEVIQDRNIDC